MRNAQLSYLLITLLFGSGILATATVSASESNRGRDRIPGQYIVVLKDSVADVDAAEQEIVATTRGQRIASYRTAVRGFAGRFSDEEIEAIKKDPRVAYVNDDKIVSINDSRSERVEADSKRRRPTDPVPTPTPTSTPVVSTQVVPTGVNRINAESKSNTGAGVVVAVIDTGVDLNHPDLKANIYGGRNCVTSNTSDYGDYNGHGTHVAGTIAALNNTFGVVGVAPNAKIASIRVLDSKGNGSWSSVICGLDAVAASGPAHGGPITVANMSLSGSGTSDNNCGLNNNDALHRAVCRVRDAGVTLVVAASNEGADASFLVPAGYNDAVITVSALTDTDGVGGGLGAGTSYGADDTFASFSNFGAPVDIAAPGDSINSTWIGGVYKAISGTSMAAPHVAGAAALYVSAHPGASWTTVRSALIQSGEAVGVGHTDPSSRHPEPVLRADSL